MPMRSCLAFSVVALLMTLTAASVARAGAEVGKPAPDFALKTIADQDVKLADMKGDVVVLDFWATWCPPCRKSLPHLNKVSQDTSRTDKGLKVLAVNCQESKAKAKGYVNKNKLKFDVALDEKGLSMRDYGVSGIPMTVVIGRDGLVKSVFTGYGGKSGETALDAAIDKALEEPKPAK